MKLNNYTNSQIRRALQVAAKLDVQFNAEDYLRSFTYYPQWSEGVEIAKYDNGGGDELVVVFKNNGIIIKGFDHESPVSPHAQDEYKIWDGMYTGAPEELLVELKDNAFEYDHVTFCYWREQEAGQWQQGLVEFKNGENDGSSWLLGAIKLTPEEYIDWAKDYYEDDFTSVSERLVFEIYKEFSL